MTITQQITFQAGKKIELTTNARLIACEFIYEHANSIDGIYNQESGYHIQPDMYINSRGSLFSVNMQGKAVYVEKYKGIELGTITKLTYDLHSSGLSSYGKMVTAIAHFTPEGFYCPNPKFTVAQDDALLDAILFLKKQGIEEHDYEPYYPPSNMYGYTLVNTIHPSVQIALLKKKLSIGKYTITGYNMSNSKKIVEMDENKAFLADAKWEIVK